MELENDHIILHNDAVFNPEMTGLYQLILGIDQHNIKILVYDETLKRFIVSGNILKPAGRDSSFRNIISEQEMFNRCYGSVNIFHYSRANTMVPFGLFEENKAGQYLSFTNGTTDNQKISHDHLKHSGIVNIFELSSEIISDLSPVYPDARHHHHLSLLAEGLFLFLKQGAEGRKIFVNIHENFFDLLIFDAHKMLLCNTFPYKTAEDYIYYLLFAMDQTQTQPESCPLYLMGGVLKDSLIYNLTFKYIRNVDFFSPQGNSQLWNIRGSQPRHFFSDLSFSVLCGL